MERDDSIRLHADDGEDEPRRPRLVISVLPSAATLGNLLCGFLAILACLLGMRAAYHEIPPRITHPQLQEFFPTYVAVGAYLVVAAMIFDALDGRLARMARRTSEFGAQLDSIADVVSFGAAPALLYVTLLLTLAVPLTGDALVSKMQWRLGLLGAVIYIGCAAIRLARYNAENVKDESAKRKFSGLPVPGAAAAFVALLVLHEELARPGAATTNLDWPNVVRWVVGLAAVGLGMLMVSRLDYPHILNVYFRREHPPSHLIGLLVVVGLVWHSPQFLLVVLAYAYVLGGVVANVVRWRRRLAEKAAVGSRSHADAG